MLFVFVRCLYQCFIVYITLVHMGGYMNGGHVHYFGFTKEPVKNFICIFWVYHLGTHMHQIYA